MTQLTYAIQKGNIYAIPIVHYHLDMAAVVRRTILDIRPACVAVELPETLELQCLHGASRLPDLSLILSYGSQTDPLFYLVEPSEGTFEALRTALELSIPAKCIDLDVEQYPELPDRVPDPYALTEIGLEAYIKAFEGSPMIAPRIPLDDERELYMAKKLKELSLQYDSVLFVGGLYHIHKVLSLVDRSRFPEQHHAARETVQLCTPTEESAREIMAECGYFTMKYEEARQGAIPDRQRLLLNLYKEAAAPYEEHSKVTFPPYHYRNLMKYARNYALIKGKLTPNLFEILSVAKSCVEHNYAYEVWEIATDYPHHKNVDGLEEIDVTIDQIWGKSKTIQFHMREINEKNLLRLEKRKDRKTAQFKPPGPFSICSYQPEDKVIENFGEYLKKKGTQIVQEEGAKTIPFSTSLEDGIDIRGTLRHFTENKLYVKAGGKPPGHVGSVVVIFDPDILDETQQKEKYPWKTTWLGEHSQESDMAFYATPTSDNVIGPGISRCEYGGLMMSYPPRRMYNVWQDPDYFSFRTKAEVLLAAAIDYSTSPLITYVAATPPRSLLKSYARRFGKKVVYLPIGQLSPITLGKLQIFHVLDGHDKREIADDYID